MSGGCAQGRDIVVVTSIFGVGSYVLSEPPYIPNFAPPVLVQPSSPVVPQCPARGDLLVPQAVEMARRGFTDLGGPRFHTKANG